MEKYKVGPNIRRYVSNVWNNQFFVLRRAGFYSEEVEVRRGCTQGDTNSPIIFNLIIDAVLRTWRGKGRKSTASFYADDGLIENQRPGELQGDLNDIIELFERVGLETNEIKTKYMVIRGAAASRALSKDKYDRIKRRGRRIGMGISEEKQKIKRSERIQCRVCKKYLARGSIARHMETQHGIKQESYPCQKR